MSAETDPDIPQDPGIPATKMPEQLPPQDEPGDRRAFRTPTSPTTTRRARGRRRASPDTSGAANVSGSPSTWHRAFEAVEEPLSRRDELARALDGLPEHERRALELRVVDGLSYARVADALGIWPAAAPLRRSPERPTAGPDPGPGPARSLPAYGSMFWFSRNTFVGSYSFFSATSRAYVSVAVRRPRRVRVAEEVDVRAAGRRVRRRRRSRRAPTRCAPRPRPGRASR